MLPYEVMQQVQAEWLDWRGTGTSVIEISHRSQDFIEHVLDPARNDIRTLLTIPENYQILFISAGTSHQFSMVPLNLLDLNKNNTAAYFQTGVWSGKAIKEAQRYGNIIIEDNINNINSKNNNYSYIHYTPNETIEGIQFPAVPNTGHIPLVADMSSEILSKPIDVNQFGLIYAGAQKNMGPSGLTFVIINEKLIGHAKKNTPILYNYKTYSDSGSLHNTPNTFSIYLSGLVFKWLLKQGGLKEIQKINERKAHKLYNYIDKTGFYHNKIPVNYRSRMNIVFYTPSPELDNCFISEAKKQDLLYLKGHKAVGGIRASIYNAMPESGVDKLVNFMTEFEHKYG